MTPIQLGPFTLEHPFILAPMAGITNSPFRRLMRRYGSSLVISELISANGLEYSSQRTRRMLAMHPEERLVGIQIFGERPELLVKAAQILEREGADFVDLNLGCPVPKIVSKGAGAAMCRNPQELERVLRSMVQAVKIPVTIKIRTGWDDSTKNALEVIEAATQAGVTWVAVHGRTRAQGYSGKADWDFIGTLKAKSQIPIIGNGDIQTGAQAVEKVKTYGVDAVLIGRGALRNPFIFRQAKDIWFQESNVFQEKPSDLLELLQTQRQMLDELFDPKGALLQVRKFLAWYAAGYPGCHEFRRKVFSLAEPDELWTEVHRFFLETRGRELGFMAENFLMGGHG